MKTRTALPSDTKQGVATLFGKTIRLEEPLENLKKGDKPQKLRTVIPFVVKSLNDANRTIEFVGSTMTKDRYGDEIVQAGWELGNFVRNPVIPWGHNYSEPPVAQAIEVGIKNGNLAFVGKYASIEELSSDPSHPSDYALFADSIYNAYKSGYLRAFSVGFIPLEYDGNWEDGYTFTKCELLEVSCVTVPANPEALVLGFEDGTFSERQRGIMIGEAKKLIKSLTPDDDSVINDGMEQEVKELKEQVGTLTSTLADFQKTLEPLKKLLEQKQEDEGDPEAKPNEEEEIQPAGGGTEDDDDLEIEGMDDDEVKSLMAGAANDAVDYKMGKIKD